MCGICGLLSLKNEPVEQHHLQPMNDALYHRGPDDAGYHCGAAIGLAMRRLSVIDVGGSEQPLYNENRSLVLVFNGEIYNYRDLRQTLQQQGHQFRTNGDGETIVHLYEQYGLDAPKYLRGQFAFGLWDADKRQLFLARDRFGQKPLYYYHDATRFAFASEIKALLQCPGVPCQSAFTPDNPEGLEALALYLGCGYLPEPQTAFRGIHSLEPGSILQVSATGELRRARYWEPPEQVPDVRTTPKQEMEIITALREQLDTATRLRMIADVPLGAFLSGGLDSSLLVALMQRASNQQVKTFSIGFAGDASFDETVYAEQVAQHLGTNHTKFIVQPKAMDLLDKLVWHHDQPFADSSAIPTYLVSELTGQHVTVALSGDGGDELFVGYERFYAARLVHHLRVVPRGLWQLAAQLSAFLPQGTSYRDPVKRATRFFKAAQQPAHQAYFDLVRVFDGATIHALTTHEQDPAALYFSDLVQRKDTLPALVAGNVRSYLLNALLVKADRCSMAASLEVRSPFLDHELAAFTAKIPMNLKLKGRTTKYILKEAARGLLPDSIIDRKKHGFGVPLGAWLRADVQPARDILLSDTARGRGLLDMAVVARLLDEHQSGLRDHNRLLWSLLTLESWHRRFID